MKKAIMLCIIFSSSLNVDATQQEPDILLYNNKSLRLNTLSLQSLRQHFTGDARWLCVLALWHSPSLFTA